MLLSRLQIPKNLLSKRLIKTSVLMRESYKSSSSARFTFYMLNIECFPFLNSALENDLAPLVIMASNEGVTRIWGTTFRRPRASLVDLFDRVLIVSTKPYSEEDIEKVIQIRYVKETFYAQVSGESTGAKDYNSPSRSCPGRWWRTPSDSNDAST